MCLSPPASPQLPANEGFEAGQGCMEAPVLLVGRHLQKTAQARWQLLARGRSMHCRPNCPAANINQNLLARCAPQQTSDTIAAHLLRPGCCVGGEEGEELGGLEGGGAALLQAAQSLLEPALCTAGRVRRQTGRRAADEWGTSAGPYRQICAAIHRIDARMPS